MLELRVWDLKARNASSVSLVLVLSLSGLVVACHCVMSAELAWRLRITRLASAAERM
jgi:uncharacterized membrane protein